MTTRTASSSMSMFVRAIHQRYTILIAVPASQRRLLLGGPPRCRSAWATAPNGRYISTGRFFPGPQWTGARMFAARAIRPGVAHHAPEGTEVELGLVLELVGLRRAARRRLRLRCPAAGAEVLRPACGAAPMAAGGLEHPPHWIVAVQGCMGKTARGCDSHRSFDQGDRLRRVSGP